MWNETELDAAAGAEDNLPNVTGGEAGNWRKRLRMPATAFPRGE